MMAYHHSFITTNKQRKIEQAKLEKYCVNTDQIVYLSYYAIF